ncbi:MAG: hypothetical protein HOJ35_02405 [Bdellovibrionales bacterium]|jgi:hypothetical protein|nr:hypothetical protein [Bdellovibrionales bacterium]
MLSKWTPWEFSRSHENIVDVGRTGVYSLNFFNHYIEKIIFNKLYGYINKAEQWVSYNGKDISTEWIDRNLLSNDLFGAYSHIIIYQSELIPPQSIEIIKESIQHLDNRYLILTSNSKNKNFDKLSKIEKVTSYNIQGPKFWEKSKIIDFLLESSSLSISYDIKNYLVQTLSTEIEDQVNAVNLLSLNQNTKLTLDKVRYLIRPSKLDSFELSALYSKKNFLAFFKRILISYHQSGSQDIEELSRFMQSHLYKILDTTYIDKKNRPTKYDKEILLYSKLWNQKDLLQSMRMFGEMQILAKTKNKRILDFIRSNFLQAKSNN